ncbi:MAG: hypothetical protein V1821_02490 [bacterium]
MSRSKVDTRLGRIAPGFSAILQDLQSWPMIKRIFPHEYHSIEAAHVGLRVNIGHVNDTVVFATFLSGGYSQEFMLESDDPCGLARELDRLSRPADDSPRSENKRSDPAPAQLSKRDPR